MRRSDACWRLRGQKNGPIKMNSMRRMDKNEERSNTHMVRKAAAHVFVMQNEVVRINCVRYFYHFDNKNDFSTNQPATKHLANVVKPR